MYSYHEDEEALIQELKASYPNKQFPPEVCMERTWDKCRVRSVAPYSRVRFVKTYDAAKMFLEHLFLPRDFTPYETGLRAERHR